MRSASRLTLALILLLATAGGAAELKQPTIDAFNRYVQLTEQRLDADRHPGAPFLRIDQLPVSERESAYHNLRNGQVVISRMETLDKGRKIEVPDGLIHHWIGNVFIPGATLQHRMGHPSFKVPHPLRLTNTYR